MLLQAERRALEGARHVEGAVAVLPAAIAERDHDLIFRHELAVEPGDALVAELLGHRILLLTRSLSYRASQMLDQRACVDRQGSDALHADPQPPAGPGIAERHDADGHGLSIAQGRAA